jgi:dihydropteroate synthase
MGVLNRTPDSFSDGGAYVDDDAALARARRMIEEGADLIDVGAESTRPGAALIPPAEQIARLGRVVEHLAREGAVISIDTTSDEVARAALDQGARIVNVVDPSAARPTARAARAAGADLVLMHGRGPMQAMRGFSDHPEDAYVDVVADVSRELLAAAEAAIDEGQPRERIALDPGFGFAKSARQSLELAARLEEIVALGFPVVAGASRKSFLAQPAAAEGLAAPGPTERLGASVAAAIACVERGAACVRVHDVAATRQALAFARALGARGGAARERPRESARA